MTTPDNPGTYANAPANAIPTWMGSKFYYHLNAATTGYQVITGPGVLLRVSVNTAATGSSIVLYDGTSTAGAVIANISTAIGYFGFIDYGVSFVNGLFIVVAGGNPDLTIMYLT